jgi:hypothetical protein
MFKVAEHFICGTWILNWNKVFVPVPFLKAYYMLPSEFNLCCSEFNLPIMCFLGNSTCADHACWFLGRWAPCWFLGCAGGVLRLRLLGSTFFHACVGSELAVSVLNSPLIEELLLKFSNCAPNWRKIVGSLIVLQRKIVGSLFVLQTGGKLLL